MPELDLIAQLGGLLGRSLAEVSEDRLEQHAQANYALGSDRQHRINTDVYSLAADGTVSGLLLQPVTSQILLGFPLHQFRHLRHLQLSNVKLKSYAFLSDLKGLTSLDLSYNRISDFSFLRDLKGLTSLDLRSNNISSFSFLRDLK
ncbi:MAG: leucine-rich repeat domain-containing protein, partial [Cyanobacteria bacterium J06597_16]